MLNKKGQTANVFSLVVYVIVLVTAGIAAAIGLSILDNVGDGFVASSLEANATTDAQEGIANITSQFGNIGLVIAAVVIIGLLVGGFFFLFRMRGGGM